MVFAYCPKCNIDIRIEQNPHWLPQIICGKCNCVMIYLTPKEMERRTGGKKAKSADSS